MQPTLFRPITYAGPRGPGQFTCEIYFPEIYRFHRPHHQEQQEGYKRESLIKKNARIIFAPHCPPSSRFVFVQPVWARPGYLFIFFPEISRFHRAMKKQQEDLPYKAESLKNKYTKKHFPTHWLPSSPTWFVQSHRRAHAGQILTIFPEKHLSFTAHQQGGLQKKESLNKQRTTFATHFLSFFISSNHPREPTWARAGHI